MRWRLKSPASRVFTQAFIQAQIKENIKAPRYWPLWGEFTGDRWIPRTEDQQREKMFLFDDVIMAWQSSFRECLVPVRRHVIPWTNSDLSWIWSLYTLLSDIRVKIWTLSFEKIYSKSCEKCRPFHDGRNVLYEPYIPIGMTLSVVIKTTDFFKDIIVIFLWLHIVFLFKGL